MSLSADQFAKAVVNAGLSSAEEIKTLWNSLPAGTRPKDGKTLAKLLIEREKLTQFQAGELLSGSTTPLALGDYVLLAKIGAGGMGQVFKARHQHMDRLVAIKLLPKDLTKDEEAIKRFQREVKAAAKLSHPNIVQAHDASMQKGVWYLVMEYVAGQDLAGVVTKEGPLPVERAVDYMRQAAKGLAFAHSKGVVHRDIKPANLLLDTEGVVKILDMGLARIDDKAVKAQEGLTQSGMVMGTVDYMAPEQAFNVSKVDSRADIYSLGCTLYRLLTGRNLFDGESLVEKLMAHQTKPIPKLAAIRPDVPATLVTIFEKMVAKLPDDRYKSMADVEAALAALISSPSPQSPAPSPREADSILSSFFQSFTGGKPAVAVQPKPVAVPVDGNSPTVSLQQAHITTDPVSQRSIQVAKQNTPQPADGKAPPFWRRPLALTAGGLGGLLLLLAAIVFFVQTSEGTIRVEINDADVEVAIQGTEIVLKQADHGKDVKLSPGDKTLIVQRGDFKFETNKLVLKNGDTVTVHVELLAGKVEVKQGNTVLGQAQLPLPTVAKAPFNAKEAKAHQKAWAKHLGTEVVKPNTIGMQMALIPPGEFLMGSSDADVALALKIAEETKLDANGVYRIQEERPQHLVRITKPFRLGMHEVTIGQFGKFIEQSGYKTQAEEFGGNSDATKADDPRVTPESKKLNWRTPGQEVGENSPVTQVSWNDAAAFCNWLSEQEKLEPSYVRDGASWSLVAQPQGYRLPTEAEWEYACRAGTTTQYSFGDDWKEHDKFGWSNGNAGGRPRGVGLLPANPFGLYDMHGNVWEWCHDWHDGKWYARSLSDDPRGPPGASFRVFRGGSWYDTPANGRSSSRDDFFTPALRNSNRGFRIALGSVGAPSSTASVTTSTPPVVPPPSVAKPVGSAPPLAKAPFDAKQARAHQEAWAKHLGVPVETTNSVGQKMVLIPPGEFEMGDSSWRTTLPKRWVRITRPFYISQFEVTDEQFCTIMGQKSKADANVLPAHSLNWNDAQEFCIRISQLNSETERGRRYRLPTEAEWEFACRAGTTTRCYTGEKILPEQANLNFDGKPQLKAIGLYPPNPFGLHDMYGNVREWCSDYYQDSYIVEQTQDPIGPQTGTKRVRRGNGYNENDAPSAFRWDEAPEARYSDLGFRIVCEVTPQPATSSKLFMHDPAFPQWMKDVQAMTAEEQIEAISKKLVELNPGFDGVLTRTSGAPLTENATVSDLRLYTDKVTDVSPVRAFLGLRILHASGRTQGSGKIVDLTPLQGTLLTDLTIRWNPIEDLSPLRGMPLKSLNFESTKVSDLTPLKGMSLSSLAFGGASVSELSPLVGMPLERLRVSALVSDLSPLLGMPLQSLDCQDSMVSDLSHLHGAPLVVLNCRHTKVVELDALGDCESLKSLNLLSTNVTAASVAALQKALPNCKIEWDDPAKTSTDK